MQLYTAYLTGRWVVLQSEVDVFLDAKAKATGVRKVLAFELVLLHLKPSLKDLQRFVAAHLRDPGVNISRRRGRSHHARAHPRTTLKFLSTRGDGTQVERGTLAPKTGVAFQTARCIFTWYNTPERDGGLRLHRYACM